MKVIEQMDILKKLQKVDTEIFAIKRKKEILPVQISKLKEDFEIKKTKVSEADKKLKQIQLQRKEKEIDLETKETGIKKCQGQLYKVKTNKEYSLLQNEIEQMKADKSVIEDDIISLMEDIDRADKQLENAKNILAEEEQNLKNQIAETEQEIKKLDIALAELEEKNNKIKADIDPLIIEQYTRILISKGGDALAKIEGETCGGCHMNLPPQVVNQVLLNEKIVTCECCARILYS